jgi:hypothetical protein
MFLADSTGSRRRVGVAIAAALDSYFPKCEKLSLIFYSAGRCQKKPYRAKPPNLSPKTRTQSDALCHFDQPEKSFLDPSHSLGMIVSPVTSARQSFFNLFFIQSFNIFT